MELAGNIPGKGSNLDSQTEPIAYYITTSSLKRVERKLRKEKHSHLNSNKSQNTKTDVTNESDFALDSGLNILRSSRILVYKNYFVLKPDIF